MAKWPVVRPFCVVNNFLISQSDTTFARRFFTVCLDLIELAISVYDEVKI